MEIDKIFYFLAIASYIVAEEFVGELESEKWSISSLKTIVDLKGPVIEVSHEMMVSSKTDSPKNPFYFAVAKTEAEHIAQISFSLNNLAHDQKIVEKSMIVDNKSTILYEIDVPKGVKSFHLKVNLFLTQFLVFLPEKIGYGEDQSVVFYKNLFMFSPYIVEKEKITFKIKESRLLDIVKGASVYSDEVIYGPYYKIQPFTTSSIYIHYVMNEAVPVITRLERTISISLWGLVTVQDKIKLKNQGAPLREEFNRKKIDQIKNGIFEWTTVLPSGATDIEYRDDIGLISTFKTIDKVFDTAIVISPRFPLLGGWKTEYDLKYSVPASEYLTNNGDLMEFSMPIMDNILTNMVVETFYLNVILPDGSQVLNITIPNNVNQINSEMIYSFLDCTGKDMLKFSQTNVVEDGIGNISINYRFSKTAMLFKPVLISLALYLLLLSLVVAQRLSKI